jgi:hypothetical protein
MVEDHPVVGRVGIFVQVIDAFGIEQRGAPLHPVNNVSLVEQKLGEIRTVLTGNA